MTPSKSDEIKHFMAKQKAGQVARMMADDGVQPEVGHFYSVSKSFTDGDNSWTDSFWEVLSLNGSNAFVRIHMPSGTQYESFHIIEQRAWYNADEAWKLRTPKS